MYELKKKIGRVLTSKSVGTGPSSCEENLLGRGLTKVEKQCFRALTDSYNREEVFLLRGTNRTFK